MIDMDPMVQELLDKKACEEVIIRYGRTLDWNDFSAHKGCYWPDASIDYGFIKTDAAGWVEKVESLHSDIVRGWHMMTSVMVVVNGDHADAESYGLAVGTIKEGGELLNMLHGGRYLDELQKRDGEWRISKRVFTLDWSSQAADKNHVIKTDDHPINSFDHVAGHASYRKM
jgi:hypothetical protein